ncbi:hypothetical protein BH09PAT2_BH09PAT2_01270 [soil metagenome]
MAPTKPLTKKPLVINPFEQLHELGSDTRKKIPEALADVFIPGSEMWGSPTPKPENMPGGPNFSPVDFDRLQNQYKQQDSSDIDKARQQLMGAQNKGENTESGPPSEQEILNRHKQYKNEEEQYYLERKQEEAEKEQEEAMQEQQKEQEEADQAQAAQAESTPQGKVRKNVMGGGKRKANMDLPPEVRHERKGGAGKH